ncbi:AAA family ATPase [Modestobacter excelsi]|uniref:AAA family ATPase n=1 Tax=Modestobacter excelsi TaxID=2213161 RepID=UPI001C20E062|nr:ATP-binding protein [Modestobacter excelsi]
MTGPILTADAVELALAHLRVRLLPLHRALRQAVERQTAEAEQLTRPDLTPFCVTAQEAQLQVDRIAAGVPALGRPAEARTDDGDPVGERELRRAAAAADVVLPLDALACRFRLDRREQDVLLLALAPELDRAWQRAYAYVVDDLNRRLPSAELVVTVLTEGGADPASVRRSLGPAGRLRRHGLLCSAGPSALGWTEELVLGPGLPEFLLGAGGTADLMGEDPDEVLPPPGYTAPPQLAPEMVQRLGAAVRSRSIDLVGLWGGSTTVQRDAALALAAAARCPLRRLPVDLADQAAGAMPEQVRAAAQLAAELGALLWVRSDELTGPAGAAVLDLLTRSRQPTVLTGAAPVRPAGLLAARSYAEVAQPDPDHDQRRRMWAAALPVLDEGSLTELASRYRLNGEEMRAVAAVADAGARLAGNGRPAPLGDHLAPAIASVTRGRWAGQAHAVTPTRTMDELVLPAEQFAHLQEVAAAFRTWPRMADAWGFRRRAGDSGVRVLFTGEPGTGKTMSADALANSLGLDLLSVDLSQVVSKWVGETEKNLESVFGQAEESQAVLFFDEADALFGKRGEVKHGTDRYANLEVGYLLQRLESTDALVILASNLRENIDPAFTRRFHFAVHFSRPGPAERRRLWHQAFPAKAPLAPDVDLDVFARLDMTGAGIVSAARSAALLAADAGEDAISMGAVVRGVARQYQREARLLQPAELGPYATFLGQPGARSAR